MGDPCAPSTLRNFPEGSPNRVMVASGAGPLGASWAYRWAAGLSLQSLEGAGAFLQQQRVTAPQLPSVGCSTASWARRVMPLCGSHK